jgi:hypothetical protein
MPHVNELQRLRTCAATAVLAAALLAGCTDTQRRAPVLADPAGQNLATAPVKRLPPIAVAGHRPRDLALAPDTMPPATTAVSIGASRRDL